MGKRRVTVGRLRLLGAFAVATLVLVAAVGAGLRQPDRVELADLVASAGPDYGPWAGGISPLREEFLQVLGLAPSASPLGAVPVVDTDTPGGEVTTVTDGAQPATPPTAPTPPTGPVTVTHDPDNDDFDDSFVVASQQLPFAATTRPDGATRQRGEPDACTGSGGSLWYAYTAADDIGLVASLLADGDVRALGVYRGSDLDRLEHVGCDTTVVGAATVAFEPEPGETYHFQVVANGARSIFSLDRLGSLQLASRHPDGTRAQGAAKWVPSISDNGAWLVYPSYARMSPDDTNDLLDFYRVDTTTFEHTLVTVAADGGSADGHSTGAIAAVSDDGRWVAFSSRATNLTTELDTNGYADTFLRDMQAGVTTRITRRHDGGEARLAEPTPTNLWPAFELACADVDTLVQGEFPAGCSYRHSVDISADGRYVVFETPLRDLVPGQPPPEYPLTTVGREIVQDWQSYRYDRLTGAVDLVGADEDGDFVEATIHMPSVSDDGRLVAFWQTEDGPFNPTRPDVVAYTVGDVWVKDLSTGARRLVSRAHGTDRPGNGLSLRGRITADGRYVVFMSVADDLLAPDHPVTDDNGVNDVYVLDLATDEMDIASLLGEGEQQELVGVPGDGSAHHPSVSANGRYVSFTTGSPSFSSEEAVLGIPDGACNSLQVYRRDRVTRTTTLASVSRAGVRDDCHISLGGMSADGSRLVWISATEDWSQTDGGRGPENPSADAYLFTFARPDGAA